MDKREVNNKRVKDAIFDAFIELLKNEAPDHISVSAIVKKAGVSRMAYYRNFESKTDIVRYFFDDVILKEILSHYPDVEVKLVTREYGIVFYSVMKKYRRQILLLSKAGFSDMLLTYFNEGNEVLAGDMPMNSIERYHLYYTAGAAFNTVMVWMKNGCIEPVETMADDFVRYFS